MELSHEIRVFLFPQNENVIMYSHRTSSLDVANKIIDEGFKYWDSFQKTTDEVINDMVYLRYWDTLRKYYGGYVIIIAISNSLIKRIQHEIHPKYEAQQALSDQLDEIDEDNSDEILFLLPRQYIKGHIDRKTGDITFNKDYDPNYEPPDLDKRIAALIE